MRSIYTSRHVAFIIPTKDRPGKLSNLLDSLAGQTLPCGRVIIVDGGESIQAIAAAYADRLSIEHYECKPPGQIRQRNAGISKLNSSTQLVGFLDDDLVLEPDALEKMLCLWNRVEPETAGIGFNLTNAPPLPWPSLLSFALMNSSTPGRVLSSGFACRIFNPPCNIRTQWLGGGYTLWRRQILLEFPQDALKTHWAIGEDLRFSYPIGKKYPLYVCAGAKVRHEHVYDQAPASTVYRYRGRKETLGLFYFVETNPELSRLACLWMQTATAFLRALDGCLNSSRPRMQYALGQLDAILIWLKAILGFASLRTELED
jgi:glycosyltransferase involved in cell wall biosynthesis